jgi:O6-methylguanine-DNA--protein-cysteine methyltransferase
VPRPRLIVPAPQLSGGQAAYVLEKLIADRRISPGEVNRYVGDMHREISELESRLQTLRIHAGASAGTGSGAPPTGKRRGRPPGSGKRRGRPPGSGRKAAAAAPAAFAAPSAGPVKRRRRARITAEQLASRQLQGRYLGLIRQIPASRRPQYQKIAKEAGREAAISAMKSAVGR